MTTMFEQTEFKTRKQTVKKIEDKTRWKGTVREDNEEDKQ